MRQYTRPAPPVKPNRRTARPERPFASGLLHHTSQDESWYFARLREAERDGPTDREYDEMAAQRLWEQAYEEGLMSGDRCAACWRETTALTNGLCRDCSDVLERDGDIGDGGVCNICGRYCDYLEESGACLPCDLRQSDMSFSGNRGY